MYVDRDTLSGAGKGTKKNTYYDLTTFHLPPLPYLPRYVCCCAEYDGRERARVSYSADLVVPGLQFHVCPCAFVHMLRVS